MNTPIVDFVKGYREIKALRLHMPGHKGEDMTGAEPMDITEISGADSLYEASGIIRESEENAGLLFGADTFYSTEGSSQAIRAMLYLATLYGKKNGKKPIIAAGRNAHKTFMSAVALLDIQVEWMHPTRDDSYLSLNICADDIDAMLSSMEEAPVALYLTSPDYLGSTVDLGGIAKVCHEHGVLLIVDNAHGAYLKFLYHSRHPMDMGADMCCDSAHKTLPVLTGGAYLHISKNADPMLKDRAKDAMALFGSTSPSYLILQSLDMANAYIANGYRERLQSFISKLGSLREKLVECGYDLLGDEPLKLTIRTKSYGYRGYELAQNLRENGIECEFADRDYCVMMLTPETGDSGLTRLTDALVKIPKRDAINEHPPRIGSAEPVMSVREAVMSHSETVSARDSVGRILASASVGCPPAVPIVVCGERITEEAVCCFEYYGIDKVSVVANK